MGNKSIQTKTKHNNNQMIQSISLCHIHDEVVDAENIRRQVCEHGLPLSQHTDEKYYCLFHLPSRNKLITEFEEAFKSRLDEIAAQVSDVNKNESLVFDFRFVWFPTAINLNEFEFRVKANFSSATFSQTAFFSSARFKQEADFSEANFENYADFSEAVFSDFSSFKNAVFKQPVYFSFAHFQGRVRFYRTKFLNSSEVFFRNTQFSDAVDFRYTIFDGYVGFWGTTFHESAFPDLQHTRIDKPERLSFHNARLHPNWFVNVDARRLMFSDVQWENLNLSIKENVEIELSCLEKRKTENSKQLLKIACYHLAENAETNNRFEEASKFRQMAFECERLKRKKIISNWLKQIKWSSVFKKIKEKVKSFPYDLSHWGYRWSSGYGEQPIWAFFVLLLFIIIPAFLYSSSLCQFPNGTNGIRSLDFAESIAYSLRAMALQRPEPFPINSFGKLILAIETVFAPLQAALLFLAIRRKFMR